MLGVLIFDFRKDWKEERRDTLFDYVSILVITDIYLTSLIPRGGLLGKNPLVMCAICVCFGNPHLKSSMISVPIFALMGCRWVIYGDLNNDTPLSSYLIEGAIKRVPVVQTRPLTGTNSQLHLSIMPVVGDSVSS